MNRIVVVSSIGILLVSSFVVGESAQNKHDITQEVLQLPDVPIRFENPRASPLLIKEAKIKVVTRAEYSQLVGSTIDIGLVDEYSTYPTVVVTNNSDQRVTGFALLLKTKRDNETRFIRFWSRNIGPHSDYTVPSSKWTPRQKTFQHTLGGGSIELGFETDPAHMWLPGGADDITVRVGLVQFEDGSIYKFRSDNSVEVVQPR